MPVGNLHQLNYVKKILLGFLLTGLILSCFQIYTKHKELALLKIDKAELSHIKYGLFSVDEWKSVLSTVIAKKINEFEISSSNRQELKKDIEHILGNVIDQVDVILREKNQQSGFKGLVNNMFMDLFVDIEDIKSGIPRYADEIIIYLESPENRAELKEFILKKFNELADNTMGYTDYSFYSNILLKYGAEDKSTALKEIDNRMNSIQRNLNTGIGIVVFIVLVFLLSILIGWINSLFDMLIALLTALVLLISGIALPMIDIEAQIENFAFVLAGEEVVFNQQMIFFQSKSILELVSVLIVNGEFALVLVAILIFSFSVLIPLLKLTGSFYFLINGRLPKTKFWDFIVFKSSKWSMADVMVVAIFMAYIGFNGVINSQLTQIPSTGQGLEVFTTNNSQLQVGFYLFTAYCLFGLLLSSLLRKKIQLIPL